MIDKLKILSIVQDALAGTDKFLVNLKISADNRIFVDIDGDNGINIDDCIELSRTIEGNLNRDEEDFELNVSSAGADSPLKMPRQYKRHIGRELEATMFDGEKIVGRLMEADDEQITIQPNGPKKAKPEPRTLKYTDIKVARVVITF